MKFLQDLLHPKSNPITEIRDRYDSLICVKCALTPAFLYEINGILYCEDCIEANERRENLKKAEKEWEN